MARYVYDWVPPVRAGGRFADEPWVDNRGIDLTVLSVLARLGILLLLVALLTAVSLQWWRQYDDPDSRKLRSRRGMTTASWSLRVGNEWETMVDYYARHPECKPFIGAWQITALDRLEGHAEGHCVW